MAKNLNKKALIALVSTMLLMISSSLFMVPIKAAQTPQPSQITLSIVVTSEQLDAVDDAIAGFLASPYGNGIDDVNVISSGDTADDQLTYIQTRMATQDTSLDVVGMDVIWTALFADNGWIENLDSYLAPNEMDDYVGGMVDSGTYNGSLWAYPYFFNLGVLFYRKDLLTTYGFDETDIDTWPELNATANSILAQENDPDLVGFAGQFDDYEGGTVNFQEWIGANGATDIFDSSGNPDLTNSKIIDALTFLKALIAPKGTPDLISTDRIISRDALTYTEGTSEAKWSAGECIFVRQWPYVYSITIANSLLNATDGMGNYTQFGVAPIPTFTGAPDEKSSCVGGAILGISKFSTHKQAAFNLTKYLCLNDSQYLALATYGHFPAYKPTYSTLPPGYEYVADFYAASDKTLARPKSAVYPDISSAISQRFSEVISCSRTPTNGMNKLQSDIEDILNPPKEIPIPGFQLGILVLALASTVSIVILLKRRRLHH